MDQGEQQPASDAPAASPSELTASGYLYLGREFFGSELFVRKPPMWSHVWLWLRGKCHYGRQPSRNREYYGQCLVNYGMAAENNPGLSPGSWKRIIAYLRSDGWIETKRCGLFIMVTDLGFRASQSHESYKRKPAQLLLPDPGPLQAGAESTDAAKLLQGAAVVWQKVLLGDIPAASARKYLVPLRTKWPDPTILIHLENYLSSRDKPETARLAQFVATFGQWSPSDTVVLSPAEVKRRAAAAHQTHAERLCDRLDLAPNKESFYRMVDVARDNFRDCGENAHGETVVDLALQYVNTRNEMRKSTDQGRQPSDA